MNNRKFIKESIEIHGDKYDYSKVNYVDNKTKVLINCPKHGLFEQTPHKHLIGEGLKMENSKSYYHITPIENLQSILKSGIKNNGSGIFLVDTINQFVVDRICLNQIFSRNVALLKIAPNGLGKIFKDNVTEFTKQHQFYTKQKKIKPEFIEVYTVFQITEDDVLENQVEYYRIIGLNYTKDQVRKIIEFLKTTNKLLLEGNLTVDQANTLTDKFNVEMSSWLNN